MKRRVHGGTARRSIEDVGDRKRTIAGRGGVVGAGLLLAPSSLGRWDLSSTGAWAVSDIGDVCMVCVLRRSVRWEARDGSTQVARAADA